VAADWHELMIL